MPVAHICATVTARLEAMPRVWQIYLHAPRIAQAARPGQFVMALRTTAYDPYLRVALPLHKIGKDTIAFLLKGDDAAHGPLADVEVGAPFDLLGPFGRGFRVNELTGNLLLIAQDLGVAPLVALAEQAVGDGKKVTLLVVAESRELLYPTELLPQAIEYRGITAGKDMPAAMMDLLVGALPWADQVCAVGSDDLYHQLYEQIVSDPLHMRPGFAQVWASTRIGCGMGVCLSCTVETRHGPCQACTDGPVFDLCELF